MAFGDVNHILYQAGLETGLRQPRRVRDLACGTCAFTSGTTRAKLARGAAEQKEPVIYHDAVVDGKADHCRQSGQDRPHPSEVEAHPDGEEDSAEGGEDGIWGLLRKVVPDLGPDELHPSNLGPADPVGSRRVPVRAGSETQKVLRRDHGV